MVVKISYNLLYTVESTKIHVATWNLTRLHAFTIACEALLPSSPILFCSQIIPQAHVGDEMKNSQQGT